jgi:chemotaxis protein methyltransferase CheR
MEGASDVAPPDLPTPTSPAPTPEPWSEADFAPIVAFLRHQIGITLEPHRMGLLQARLRSRLQAKGFGSFTQFGERVLKADPSGPGMQLLIDLSTVNHTAFFREPAHFTIMAEHVAGLLKEGAASTVRLWSAGCSTGQEPYSMAMVLAETIPGLSAQRVEIWASDLSREVLEAAARASERFAALVRAFLTKVAGQ